MRTADNLILKLLFGKRSDQYTCFYTHTNMFLYCWLLYVHKLRNQVYFVVDNYHNLFKWSMSPYWENSKLLFSQLIRYSRTCSCFQDFIDRSRVFTRNLIHQSYMLIQTTKKLYWMHIYTDVVGRYNICIRLWLPQSCIEDWPLGARHANHQFS